MSIVERGNPRFFVAQVIAQNAHKYVAQLKSEARHKKRRPAESTSQFYRSESFTGTGARLRSIRMPMTIIHKARGKPLAKAWAAKQAGL